MSGSLQSDKLSRVIETAICCCFLTRAFKAKYISIMHFYFTHNCFVDVKMIDLV